MTTDSSLTVWLNGPREIELRREPLAAPKAGEVSCETIVTAISPGTELAAYTGLPPLRPGPIYPRLVGYCNVARVIESKDERYQAGDRVLSFAPHRSHFVIAADDVLLKLPEDSNADTSACSYLFHLGYNAMLRSTVRPGSKVLVIGMGALGLTTVATAALSGATVYALTDHKGPALLALEMGATQAFGRDSGGSLSSALGDGADVVVVTTNGWSDWAQALRLAARNGVIAVLGFPGRNEPPGNFNPLDSQYFYTKQLRIEAVGFSPQFNDSRGFLCFNERANIAWLERMIQEQRLKADLLISGHYHAGEIDRAYEDLLARKGSPVTYLLDWQSE